MTLPLIKDSNSVNLDGTEYRTIGWVSRQEVNRYAGKVVTGDTSRESRPHLSALALTDWRGGMGVDRYHGRGEVDRTFFGNLDTRFEGHMTLPPRVRTLPAGPVTGDITGMGVLDGFLYAVITRTIYKYLGGGNWGSAVKTLTGNPTQVTNFSIGETEYLIVAHTEGVSYTSDGSTWVDITTNRDTVGDFDLSGGASHPTGMFFANSKLYVGDSDDDKIYGFAVNGDRNAGDDINSLPTSDLQGIASSGTRIYLLDGAAQNVKVINFSGVREQDLDFDLAPLNTDPKGIAVKADGTTILVLDGARRKVFGYQRVTAAGRVTGQDYAPIIPGDIRDISKNGGDFYGLSSTNDSRIYVFGEDGVRDTSMEIVLPVGTWQYLTNDGTTIWSYESTGRRLYAWTMSTRARDFDKERVLVLDNGSPAGLFSKDGLAYVWDSTDERLYPYG